MQNKSSTKKSLLFSAFSLFLSLVLLAGTTFAWFTDTASTSVNAIHSGTLDVKHHITAPTPSTLLHPIIGDFL